MALDLSTIKNRLQELQTAGQRSTSGPRKQVVWRPSVGKQTIRIVPSETNKQNPFSELYFYYGIGDRPMISPKVFGKKDPIEEFAKHLRSQGDRESYALARKLDAKMRVYVPIIVRGEESEGVKLWNFGKEIYMELLSMFEDEDIGDYTDILTGRDINLTTVGPDVTGTGYNKTTLRARVQATPLAATEAEIQALLTNQPNPLEIFTPLGFDEMKQVLQKYLAPEEEEGAVSSEPAAAFDSDEPEEAPKAPWAETTAEATSKFSLEAQGKKPESKASKFESLFSDDDDLPF